ncbi:2937_t:CDS:2 [Funneliformis geosporum]|uniref:2937_t:CDS:1 n=1 Tax=Funneliformis geosporum TaxID=1117311 RepID=A0A9W4WT85_9GLOM|nr:2937_t:CDS:2 [Funneliformis geosporum]
MVEISAYLKNKGLKKFRRLGLEEQIKRKKEISSLVERDNETISCHWQQGEEKNLIRKRNKETVAREHVFINREIDNMVLVNSMGLRTDYEKEQQTLTEKSNLAKISTKKIVNLELTIPWRLLVNLFPFILLILEPRRVGIGNWSDYASSRARVVAFLNLPEKNDNLKGIKFPLSSPIKEITFEQVSFKYQGSNDRMNYNATFSTGKINYLSTPNGSGKTTQLYLLLGLLNPVKGEITIKNKETKSSTGQKQLANLKQVLASKAEAQVFIFDEADNALDKQNQIWF